MSTAMKIVVIIGALSVSSFGADYAWVPVDASGGFTLNGNEIVLQGCQPDGHVRDPAVRLGSGTHRSDGVGSVAGDGGLDGLPWCQRDAAKRRGSASGGLAGQRVN